MAQASLTWLYTAGVQISAKVDYGVRALLVLATAPEPMTADALATDQGLPGKFLGVILNDLRRAGVGGQPSRSGSGL